MLDIDWKARLGVGVIYQHQDSWIDFGAAKPRLFTANNRPWRPKVRPLPGHFPCPFWGASERFGRHCWGQKDLRNQQASVVPGQYYRQLGSIVYFYFSFFLAFQAQKWVRLVSTLHNWHNFDVVSQYWFGGGWCFASAIDAGRRDMGRLSWTSRSTNGGERCLKWYDQYHCHLLFFAFSNYFVRFRLMIYHL
jgi:hypothetical protein